MYIRIVGLGTLISTHRLGFINLDVSIGCDETDARSHFVYTSLKSAWTCVAALYGKREIEMLEHKSRQIYSVIFRDLDWLLKYDI